MHTSRVNRVESDVQQFWTDSLAWREGDNHRTVGDLLNSLNDIAETTNSNALQPQVDDLAMLVIHAKRRRKRVKSLGKSKVTKLKQVTDNSGHSMKKAAVA